MKKSSLIIILVFIMSSVFGQSGESKYKEVNISSKKSTPPKLVITSDFFDNNGNKSIDAGETAKINVKVENQGIGPAEDLVLSITSDNNNFIEIDQTSLNLGTLSANSSKSSDILLTASPDLPSGTIKFTINVKEKDGFDASPASMMIPTREKAAPMLAVEDYKFTTDQGGPVKLGSPVDLSIVCKNNGDGKAENLVVKFTPPQSVFPVANSEFKFISLGIGEQKLITFSFLPNEQYTAKEIPIDIKITEKTGKYGTSQTLTVNIEDELYSSGSLITEGSDDLILRGGGDPLKGLNVADAKKEMQVGYYYALIIGVDNYHDAWKPLKNAVNDAKAIESLLKSKYKFDHFITLYDSEATRKEILRQFEWLVANVKETDNVFIYYSGHGEYKKQLNKGYWVPVDAKTTSVADYISNNDIQTFLSGIRSKHTLLIADACFAGDIFRGKTVSVPFENSEKYYAKVHNLVSRKAISSGGIEPVMDGGRDGHSVFAYYLIKALKGNTSRFFDASQLYESIKIPVINNSEQSPNFNPIKNTGDEGGQFIFIQK